VVLGSRFSVPFFSRWYLQTLKLAKQYHFDTQLVAMKSTHHAEMKELLIGRNLDWAR
jgi:hypothetical protein